ncbi:hypothetical protein PROFUN_08278 [Planoprotostelium fungivorum]|uniref:Uncharacterized protein n=1 Tax=Planoprotostelium fungivorum TaxID=1890364 RepID=A0A2P6NJW1_9EUKA|nr:hypothetical protein PROFUN_08278 [Planoprotostelium fungivorum]
MGDASTVMRDRTGIHRIVAFDFKAVLLSTNVGKGGCIFQEMLIPRNSAVRTRRKWCRMSHDQKTNTRLMSITQRIAYLVIFLYHLLGELFFKRKPVAPRVDQTGKVFVITGANTGIGKETAKQIGLMGAEKVYITSRNAQKGQKTIEELRSSNSKTHFEVIPLDLDSLASVETAAAELKKKEEKIDVLILNAGIGFYELGAKTADGYDQMYQSNHLGHHLLFERLLPLLRKASKPGKPSRVVVLSSAGHYLSSEEELSNMEISKKNSGFSQYSATKLMNLLFVRYMSKKYSPDIVFHGVHPGAVTSDFFEKFPQPMKWISRTITSYIYRTPQYGASTSVYVATHPDAEKSSGDYWGSNQRVKPHHLATNDKVAEKFMKISSSHLKLVA